MAVTFVMVVRIPVDGVERFREYEAHVLPLLAEHGGRLERRLHSREGRVEVHVVTFPSTGAFVAYRDDPRRAEWRALLVESGAEQEIFELFDVPTE